MGFQKGVSFSLEEVFEMAKKIEINGEKFYRAAAEKNQEHREFLLKMADQEKGHEILFTKMAERLVSEENRILNNEKAQDALKYLEALAGSRVFVTTDNSSPTEQHYRDAQELFDEAITREKDAIIFFLGLKELLPDLESKQKIDELISEEMTHITWIKRHSP